MTFLGNLLWLVFGGLLAAIGYWVTGLGLCLTVVGIPFGLMNFRIGLATLAPFGKEVVERPHANSALRVIFNVLWIFSAGWGLALHHLLWALVLAITIVGIPFAKQHLKLIPLALMPFGRDLE
jgi:uncharacterized membrane protein YccF (DUF307 family)